MAKIVAAVMPGPHKPIELRELDEPALAPDSALLAVECSEVCGTDVHLWEGRLDTVPYPLIPGHVSAGVLAKIRGTLCDVDGRPFREGERVTFLDVHGTCGRCWYCLVAKASTRCPHRRVYGITYGLADGPSGGWASHVYLKPGTKIVRLDSSAALFMAGGCSLPTAMHAIEHAGIRTGDAVLVLGSGPVGLSAIALARRAGAGRVLCIGAPAERLAMAKTVGADAGLDLTGADVDARGEWVRDLTDGRGADVTIEATGAPEAVVQAMRWTRDAGRVVVVGQYTDAGDVTFNPHRDLNRKHLTIYGVWGCDYSHVHRAVAMLRATGPDGPWGKIRCTSYDLSRAEEALHAVAAGSVVKALITPTT